jgi:tetratricopeptide (TPR) repeat protein
MGVNFEDIVRKHRQGELDQAESEYRAFLDEHPDDVSALQMFGLLLKQRGRPVDAVAVFRRVVAAAPSVADHWANYGGMQRAADRAAAAEGAYGQALALSPAEATVIFNLANLLGVSPPGGLGRPVAAAAWYGRALVAGADSGQTQNNLDILQRNNPDLFEAAARRGVALAPGSAAALQHLGRLLLQRSGLPEWRPGKVCELRHDLALEAFDLLRRADHIQPDDGNERSVWLALALDLFQLGVLDNGRLRHAARAAWRRLRVHPKDILSGAVIGYHAYRQGRLPLATRLQRRFLARFSAAEIAADVELGFWSMLRVDGAFFESLPSAENVIERLPAMEIAVDVEEGAGPVIFFGGDEVYARRFGPKLLQSLARHCPGATVILHLTAASPAALNLVTGWRRLLPSLKFGVSYERLDISSWPQIQRSVYFACVRFIRALQWRRRLQRPIVLIDLDAEARSDLRLLASDMKDHDLGMMLDQRQRGPTREIPVGFVYYNDTPPAEQFMATVAAYIGNFLLDGSPRWMLDQVSHLAALHWLRRKHPSPRVLWYDFQTFPHCGFVGEK